MTIEIPFFRYPHVFAQYRGDVLAAFLKTADRGAYILQDEVREFEEAVAGFTGARHVVGVANGTDGLTLALRAAGIGAGDEVIMASHTYVATAAAVWPRRRRRRRARCTRWLTLIPAAEGQWHLTALFMASQNGHLAVVEALQRA